MGKSCSKFNLIPPGGLGGDNLTRTDRWMDGGIHNVPVTFWTGFSKNLSFKIVMSGRALGVCRDLPRLTFLSTFFQSYILPLFFSGLLSYLVGMKRRTSRCFPCKRDNSHFLHYLKKTSIMPFGIFLILKSVGLLVIKQFVDTLVCCKRGLSIFSNK